MNCSPHLLKILSSTSILLALHSCFISYPSQRFFLHVSFSTLHQNVSFLPRHCKIFTYFSFSSVFKLINILSKTHVCVCVCFLESQSPCMVSTVVVLVVVVLLTADGDEILALYFSTWSSLTPTDKVWGLRVPRSKE